MRRAGYEDTRGRPCGSVRFCCVRHCSCSRNAQTLHGLKACTPTHPASWTHHHQTSTGLDLLHHSVWSDSVRYRALPDIILFLMMEQMLISALWHTLRWYNGRQLAPEAKYLVQVLDLPLFRGWTCMCVCVLRPSSYICKQMIHLQLFPSMAWRLHIHIFFLNEGSI